MGLPSGAKGGRILECHIESRESRILFEAKYHFIYLLLPLVAVCLPPVMKDMFPEGRREKRNRLGVDRIVPIDYSLFFLLSAGKGLKFLMQNLYNLIIFGIL